MTKITVTCDRCKQTVEGIINGFGTGEFYIRTGWAEYMMENETIICDECMFKNQEYKKIYGEHKRQEA